MEDDKKMEEAVVPSPTAVVLLGGQGQHLSSSSSSAAADNHDEIETRKQGGLITMPFIIGNEAFEKVASYGVAPNMIMYLMKDYKMGVAKAANILFLWSAATNFMPLFGAFLSDSFLGRYLTITIGSFFTLLAILPLASKLWGRPVKLSTKLRMGLGLVVSSLSMVAAATVENARRKKAIQEVNMSAMWLVPQYVLLGLAESLNAIGQIEFYYSEFPKSMSSIASCLFGVGMGVASLLSSVILSVVNKTTSKDGNINQARYDNYYWVLAIMGAVNVVYFLLCSWAYGACADEMTKVGNGGNVFNEEDEMGNDRHSLEGKEQLNR
ncbi:Protein NRT1/ PTR FAMILY 1.2 [Linum perenne]